MKSPFGVFTPRRASVGHPMPSLFAVYRWTAHPKPRSSSPGTKWLVCTLPCVSFGSRKSRGTAEFVIQSRSRGQTLISDGWMSCVSLKGTKFEALWRGAEGAPSFFLPFFFVKLTIVNMSNETRSRRERARSSACWDFVSDGTFVASDVKIRLLSVSRPFVRRARTKDDASLDRSIDESLFNEERYIPDRRVLLLFDFFAN